MANGLNTAPAMPAAEEEHEREKEHVTSHCLNMEEEIVLNSDQLWKETSATHRNAQVDGL